MKAASPESSPKFLSQSGFHRHVPLRFERPPVLGRSADAASVSERSFASLAANHVSRQSQTSVETPGGRRKARPPGPREGDARFEILLVEDNPGDARLTREVFGEGQTLNEIHVVSDGVEALRFLRKENPFPSAPRPDLVLLDLNLPRKDGQELLAEIKSDVELRSIPIIVLTTSAADEDIDRTYLLHANAFITKPVDLDQFIEVVRSIENFWLKTVRLPHRRAAPRPARARGTCSPD